MNYVLICYIFNAKVVNQFVLNKYRSLAYSMLSLVLAYLGMTHSYKLPAYDTVRPQIGTGKMSLQSLLKSFEFYPILRLWPLASVKLDCKVKGAVADST